MLNKWPQSCSEVCSALTFLSCFKAVVEVYPLDVIGEGCVGQQSSVPVNDVGGESEGLFLGAHHLRVGAICVLKDSSCKTKKKIHL